MRPAISGSATTCSTRGPDRSRQGRGNGSMTETPGVLNDEQDVSSPSLDSLATGYLPGEEEQPSSPGSGKDDAPVLELRSVLKRFGGAVALSGVEFSLRR